MFDLLKKKEPLLFKMKAMLDPCDDDVLMKGCQLMKLKDDGTAYAGKEKAGKIPANVWEYITSFCTPKKMQRTGYNSFEVEVRGAADIPNAIPDPHDKPYIYRCGHEKHFPHMLPGTEYLCALSKNGDDLDIIVNDQKIGTVTDKDGRVKRLEDMIRKGFQTSAQIEPSPMSCGIFLIVRKV